MEEILKRIDRFDPEFLDEIQTAYLSCEKAVGITAWLNRMDQVTQALKQGKATYRQVEDHVFELKLINYLLKLSPGCKLTYEPKGISNIGKNCDIEITLNGLRYLVEAKCFHPEWKKAEIPQDYIAKNNRLFMDGESYHTYQATRGHLIEATQHTEQKIKNYDGDFISVLAVPVGFHLSIEDLRDFIFIYRNGQPRSDDPLGLMTMHNMLGPFERTIAQFWAFPFPQQSFSIESNKSTKVLAPLKSNDRSIEL